LSGFSVILIPTDLSEPARDAVELACTLACRGGRLIVAHLVGDEPRALSNDRADVPGEWLGASRPGDPGLKVERVVRGGPAAEAIVSLAEELGCELIVLGSHGREGVELLLMGSVAQEVLRRAACPVLCLPTPTPVPTSTAVAFAAASPTGIASFLRID
jgi:nucleotide-binding universal stress UspA family protein